MMKKTIFEEMGGTYTQIGDYFLPDLKLPEEETKPIGIWGPPSCFLQIDFGFLPLVA